MHDVSTLREVTEQIRSLTIGDCTIRYYVDEQNVRQGHCYTYDKDNLLRKVCYYVDGIKHGLTNYYMPTGELFRRKYYIMSQLHYEDTYYESGKLYMRFKYGGGKKNGPFETYHENGRISEKGIYKDNKFDGLFESFHQNGIRKCKETYKDNCLEGWSYEYSDTNELVTAKYFQNDVEILPKQLIQL